MGNQYRFKNRRVYWRVPDEVRAEIIRLAAHGVSSTEIVRRFPVHRLTVVSMMQPLGGMGHGEPWAVSEARLSIDERIDIALGLTRGESFRAIGRRIGRAASTVSREVNAAGGRCGYQPMTAHRRAHQRARRPKRTKLSANPRLRRRVAADLRRLWSPEQIARRLRVDFGDDEAMRISHETIYRSLYVQGRGELRRELSRCLRSGRVRRKPRGRQETRGRIPDMVMISQRPAEADDRAVPGHWEGDLILGKDHRSAIGTLVERSTRYVMLLDLRQGKSAEDVRKAMTAMIKTLPETLRRSIAWDQGSEMAEHVRFRIDTGVQIYFCDPRSPWQRGSNENTNGLLRQYFPKGTDLSVHGPKKLKDVADALNTRPRKTLGWKTPAEKLGELVATTG
jgi:IS30 family transposase